MYKSWISPGALSESLNLRFASPDGMLACIPLVAPVSLCFASTVLLQHRGLCYGCTRSNKLVDLPDELAELGQLHTLRCKYNLLQRLPAVLARLPLLTTLVHFFGIPLNLTAYGVASL